MSQVLEMLNSNKSIVESLDVQELATCIQECFNCAQVADMCADACLSEDDVKMMVRCIRINTDASEICETTAKMLSRQTAWSQDIWHHQLHACVTALAVCSDECNKHADMYEHCRICAEACDRCRSACINLIDSLHL